MCTDAFVEGISAGMASSSSAANRLREVGHTAFHSSACQPLNAIQRTAALGPWLVMAQAATAVKNMARQADANISCVAVASKGDLKFGSFCLWEVGCNRLAAGASEFSILAF